MTISKGIGRVVFDRVIYSCVLKQEVQGFYNSFVSVDGKISSASTVNVGDKRLRALGILVDVIMVYDVYAL